MSTDELLTVKEAANVFNKKRSNISYLLSYHSDRIKKYDPSGNEIKNASPGELRVSFTELKRYYDERKKEKREQIKALNIENEDILFTNLSDSERTKHVHGLHPYMGKFIPQLAEYYLSRNFSSGDTIIDPFAGSGTTLIEANSLNMKGIGIDISEFNCILMNAKLTDYNLKLLKLEILHVLDLVSRFSWKNWKDNLVKKGFLSDRKFDKLYNDLFQTKLNFSENQLLNDEIKRTDLSKIKKLRELRNSPIPELSDFKEPKSEYLRNWLAPRTNAEINYYTSLIPNYHYKDILRVIVSKATRSSRLIKHSDLTRPTDPIEPGQKYECSKHKGRLCEPIDNAIKWIRIYSTGTRGAINRINKFSKIRKNALFDIIHGDSTKINVLAESKFGNNKKRFIDGIFTSPPYLGVINYHQQHKYAFDLFGLEMLEDEEIGNASKGTSAKAKEEYISLVAQVFKNVGRFLKLDANVFVVANDKYDLYNDIFERAGYSLEKETIRGVYKRADYGGANTNYSEKIFKVALRE